MSVASFLACIVLAVVVGAYMSRRWVLCGMQLNRQLARFERDVDINDAADMSETACDWGGDL
jgi:hypothetical protein